MDAMTTDAPQISANDLIFAKEMAEVLHAHYPGHLWAVSVEGGMADIRNLMLSSQYGYRLRLPDVYSMSSFRHKVIHAGGEILERFKVLRGRADFEAMAGLPVDIAGRPIGDKSQ